MKYNCLGICRSLLQHAQLTHFFSIVPAPTTSADINNLIIFAGSLLTLTCTVTLDETLGSMIGDLSVASVWTGPNGVVSTGGHIVISETTKNDISYSSFVGFNTVHTDDAGDYTCTATVSPSVPSNMVMNGVGSSDPVNFSVDGKIAKVFHLVYEVLVSSPQLPLSQYLWNPTPLVFSQCLPTTPLPSPALPLLQREWLLRRPSAGGGELGHPLLV